MSTLAQRIIDLATRIATEIKAHRTLINGNAADLSALTTTNKTNLVAALNELKASLGAAGAQINDASAASLTETYSITKIRDYVTTAIAQLTTGAPAAMDTLDELSAALGDDANFATTITTALGNRVRVDAAQALTAPQKAQARSNIGADITSAETGNTDTDFVSTFNAGLV
jgi:hypothetical protein